MSLPSATLDSLLLVGAPAVFMLSPRHGALPSFPQEHSVRDLVGPGPFTVFAPTSAAFDEEPRVSMA